MTEYVKKKEIMIAISQKIEECTACPLGMERTNAVPGEGSLESPVVFVGEAPEQMKMPVGDPLWEEPDNYSQRFWSRLIFRERMFI